MKLGTHEVVRRKSGVIYGTVEFFRRGALFVIRERVKDITRERYEYDEDAGYDTAIESMLSMEDKVNG